MLPLLTAVILAGCASDKGVQKGPQGTIAYTIQVESSQPGVRIEVNNEDMGVTPLTLTIYGDRDGTFHNFGSGDYVIKAYPPKEGGYVQRKMFRTGGLFQPEDMIPKRIYFDTDLDTVHPRDRIDVNSK